MMLLSLLCGCDDSTGDGNTIKFATCADYPPFEYSKNGELVGFDIDMAQLIAHELKMKAQFEDMQFSAILASLQQKSVDAAISAIATTDERKQKIDFSSQYYSEVFAAVYKKSNPVTKMGQLTQVKIACQLGTTMEIWLKKNFPQAAVVAVDNNGQAIEMLKAGHVECVFINLVQAEAFCQTNIELAFTEMVKSNDGYAVALPKGSKLLKKIDKAIAKLKAKGKIDQLKQKWMVK
jgi:polar amino acid transport system substrate-binding protein